MVPRQSQLKFLPSAPTGLEDCPVSLLGSLQKGGLILPEPGTGRSSPAAKLSLAPAETGEEAPQRGAKVPCRVVAGRLISFSWEHPERL